MVITVAVVVAVIEHDRRAHVDPTCRKSTPWAVTCRKYERHCLTGLLKFDPNQHPSFIIPLEPAPNFPSPQDDSTDVRQRVQEFTKFFVFPVPPVEYQDELHGVQHVRDEVEEGCQMITDIDVEIDFVVPAAAVVVAGGLASRVGGTTSVRQAGFERRQGEVNRSSSRINRKFAWSSRIRPGAMCRKINHGADQHGRCVWEHDLE